MRFVINWGIKVGLLYLLNFLGWITLHPSANVHSAGDTLLCAAAIALIFTVVMYLVWLAYALLLVGTCGVALILLPFMLVGVGYGVLKLIEHVAPDYLSVTPNFWLGILTGLILSVVQLPSKSREAVNA